MNTFAMRIRLNGGKSVEFHGPADITKEDTDAIVNAANSSLMGGGGVDGAIHRRGGPTILAECQLIVKKIGRLRPGEAVITTAGHLPAKYVIHTVGPIYRDGNHGEPATLANCYHVAIRVAEEHALRSLAFPAISTGAYGYPVKEAADVAVTAVVKALNAASSVTTVRFVLFDAQTLKAYTAAAEKLLGTEATPPFKIEKAIP